jgi:protein-tyrosine phosphatase
MMKIKMKTPHTNCYWITPGKLMGGEYPGATTKQKALEKIIPLLDAGVNFYVDLTEEYELVPYDTIIRSEALARGMQVDYVRFGYRDGSVPQNRAHMVDILDTIDEAISAGKVVYVHCWGGIGRTGTVLGCHLVRHGMSGPDALVQISRLYRAGMEKSGRRPDSPETEPQVEWVRNWLEAKE